MNPYDLTATKAFADLELLDGAKTNEYLNHTQLGYTASGANPSDELGVLMAVLGFAPRAAEPLHLAVSGWGDVVNLRVLFVLAPGGDLAVAANGNVADTTLFLIERPEWRPRIGVAGTDAGGSDRAGVYNLTAGGAAVLAHANGSGPIAQGTTMSAGFTYVRRGL